MKTFAAARCMRDHRQLIWRFRAPPSPLPRGAQAMSSRDDKLINIMQCPKFPQISPCRADRKPGERRHDMMYNRFRDMLGEEREQAEADHGPPAGALRLFATARAPRGHSAIAAASTTATALSTATASSVFAATPTSPCASLAFLSAAVALHLVESIVRVSSCGSRLQHGR